MENGRGEKDIQEINKINSVGELVGFCLKSKSFDVLLIFALVIFFFAVIMTKQTVSSGSDEMEGIFVIFSWILEAILFFIIILKGMMSITSKIRKSVTSVILFAVITAAIPISIIMCYFRYLITHS